MNMQLPNKIDWIRVDLKFKIEVVKSFVIAEHNDVVNFAEFLTHIVGFKLYSFRHEEPWIELIDTYSSKCNLGIADPYYEEFHPELVKEYILSICQKLNKCVEIKDRQFVNDFLHIYTRKVEDERNRRYRRVHYMSGDEEARECNRQFNSMMEDNDAWGNID